MARACSSKEYIKYENHIPLSWLPSFQAGKLPLMNAAASGTCTQPVVAPMHNGVIPPISAHYNIGRLEGGGGDAAQSQVTALDGML